MTSVGGGMTPASGRGNSQIHDGTSALSSSQTSGASPFFKPKKVSQKLKASLDDPLARSIRSVDSHFFRGGQIEWSLTMPYSDEQSLTHQLGKIPTGMFLVRSTAPVAWYASKNQQDRWTRDTLYFHVHVLGTASANDTFVWQVY